MKEMEEMKEMEDIEFKSGAYYFGRRPERNPNFVMLQELERQRYLQNLVETIPVRPDDQVLCPDDEKKE